MTWSDQNIDRLFQGAKAPEPPPFEDSFWTEMEAMLQPENTEVDHVFQGAKAPEPPPFEEAFWTEMEAMLPENTEIDAVFQGVQAPAPPPFREAYWTEMEAMLPRKKRRVAAIWWFSGGAAMVLLLAGMMWYFTGNKEMPAGEKSRQLKSYVPTKAPGENAAPADDASHPAEMHGENPSSRMQSAEVDVPVAGSFQNTIGAHEHRDVRSYVSTTNAPAQNAGSSGNDRVSANYPTDIRHGESTPEQSAGTISATTATVTPLNPLPFGYELDAVAARLPETKQPRPARFYAQLSVGAGQSAQRNVIGASDFLHYYAVGGGLYTRVDNMVLTFGLNGRVDFTDNVVRTVGTEIPGNRIETSYKQLYSIETPASLGYTLGRNVFTATVTPGFQTGFSGQEREYVAETQVRSEQTSGKVKNSRTLTMEFGLSYWRVLQPDWQLGVGMNFDALRPFNNSLFAGEQRLAPLNGQIMLRRTF